MTRRITSIAYIRGISALLIFVCHILFISGAFEISMWFNTGVPLFFIISAYLLSLKKIDSHKKFYCRRFKSIFPSYWIYLAAIVLCLIVVGRAPDVKSIICYGLGLSGFTTDTCVLGLGHLWFISVLLLCYLLTPLLHRLIKDRSGVPMYATIAVIIALLTVIFLAIGIPAYSIHCASYIFVYTFYCLNKGVVSKHQMTGWIIAAVVLSAFRLILDPIFIGMEYTILYYYDSLFQPIARFGLAMAIFTIFVYNSERIEAWAIKSPRLNNAITGFSNLSYEVYLSHQFILLAFWEFIPYFHTKSGIIIWSIVSFVATIANALILAKTKDIITNKLINI